MSSTASPPKSKVPAKRIRHTARLIGNAGPVVKKAVAPGSYVAIKPRSKTMTSRNLKHVGLYHSSQPEFVEMVRKGVAAVHIEKVARELNFTKEFFYDVLDFSSSTIERKIRNEEKLSPEQTERVLGLERLIGQVEDIVSQSGNADGFEASRWLGEWLDRPLQALGGAKPVDYMDTVSGQQLVSKLLSQIQSGAYA